MKRGSNHMAADDAKNTDESEITPLLSNSNVAPVADSEAIATRVAVSQEDQVEAQIPDDDDKPLPVLQILILCTGRYCESLSFFSIFPFVNQMVMNSGNLSAAEVGFYTGLIESLFSVTQMLVMVGWGRLSDRYGRKPVLVMSLVGLTFFTGLFGFARTIWQMFVFRCLNGAFSAVTVTIRTMIGEHSRPKTEARAYSWFAFAGNLGILIGPLIGGVLADPAEQYGGIFKKSRFLGEYPYALSSVATALFPLLSLVAVVLKVEETLDVKKGSTSTENSNDEIPEMGIWELIKQPGVTPVLSIGAVISVLAFGYTSMNPVFQFEPIKLGGYGFSSVLISVFIAIAGAAQSIWLVVIFPPLHRRIATGGILRWCAYAYPLFFGVNPALSMLLRYGGPGGKKAFWILAPTLLAIGSGIAMCFSASVLALNAINPSRRTLGTLNALQLSIQSAMRSISPALFTSLYAIGVKKQILGGYLGWAVLIGIAFVYIVSLRWLPAKAAGKPTL